MSCAGVMRYLCDRRRKTQCIMFEKTRSSGTQSDLIYGKIKRKEGVILHSRVGKKEYKCKKYLHFTVLFLQSVFLIVCGQLQWMSQSSVPTAPLSFSFCFCHNRPVRGMCGTWVCESFLFFFLSHDSTKLHPSWFDSICTGAVEEREVEDESDDGRW